MTRGAQTDRVCSHINCQRPAWRYGLCSTHAHYKIKEWRRKDGRDK